jgi:hypothetical protein
MLEDYILKKTIYIYNSTTNKLIRYFQYFFELRVHFIIYH